MKQRTPRWGPREESRQLYNAYDTEEDKARTNAHYEQPVEFFAAITGGEWNVYSANVWDGAVGETASQEAKLDLLARLMDLKPGQRILDVGCGWGGPLVYLCKQYGAHGVGLTLSPMQRRAAAERAARHGVDATFVERHWQEFADDERFDAVFTDEVIVHFTDLGGFFRRVHGLLRPEGRMVNKELHFVHPRHAEMTRAMTFINEIYGATGNYRTLAEELRLANEAGFEVQTIHQMRREHYQRTLDQWLHNMHEHRARLENLVGADHYRRFRGYLKLVRHVLGGTTMTLDVVVAHKAVDGSRT